jgi:hypothetical protein
MLVALAAVLAALLSKETALAAAAAVGFVWLRGARIDRSKLRALVALVAVVALFFAWRTAVLGTLTTGLTGGASIVDAFGRGFLAWSSHLLDYATFGARSGIVLAIVVVVYFVLEFERLTRARGHEANASAPARIDVLICGICLFVLPAILQAPIAALNATPLRANASAVEAAMQSRLYYVSFGGLAILFAAGIGRIWPRASIPRAILGGALAFCVAAFAWVSHDAATAFARTTAASRPVAEAVAAAVDRAASDSRCRIVVLGVARPREWSIYVSIDSIAKALTTDVDRVGRCFIESDYVTYFNLMRGEANPADAMPYIPRSANARPIPWLRVGGMASAYLDPPANADSATLAGIVFLRYENGTFTDATSDVAAGHIPALR